MISVKLNSKEKWIKKGSSVSDLLKFIDLKKDGIVVEINLNIIKKDRYEDTILKSGDSVEIITFMGGG